MSITDNHQKYSPSAQLRAIEIISELLASTSPHKLGEVLTAHLRELTGARTIKVLAHRPQPDFDELLYSSPQLPIIISSGFGEADITSKIPREAMAGLINKPYSFDQLREVLRGVVKQT